MVRCKDMPKNGKTRAALAAAAVWFLTAAAPPPLQAQDLLENLRTLGRDAGREYMEPAASSFGAAMNSGWFHRAPEKRMLGLDIDFGLVTVGGMFVGAPTHFSSNGTFSFNRLQMAPIVDSLFNLLRDNPRVALLSDAEREELRDTLAARLSGPELKATLSGPTAIGPKRDSLIIEFENLNLPISIPSSQEGEAAFDTTLAVESKRIIVPAGGALDALPFLPLLAPTITVGTLYGTHATLRWLPKIKIADDLGKVGLFGFGVQHNLAYWLGPMAPLDLTLDAHGQWLEVENTFTSSAVAGGITVSRQFGSPMFGIMPFAGAALQNSGIDADFDAEFDSPFGAIERRIQFSLDGENRAHYTVGLALRFFRVNLTSDYSFAEYDSFSAGLMVML